MAIQGTDPGLRSFLVPRSSPGHPAERAVAKLAQSFGNQFLVKEVESLRDFRYGACLLRHGVRACTEADADFFAGFHRVHRDQESKVATVGGDSARVLEAVRRDAQAND